MEMQRAIAKLSEANAVVLTIFPRQIVYEAPVDIGVATKIHGDDCADTSRRQPAHAPTARNSSRIQTNWLIYYRAIFNRCGQINICMFRQKISEPTPDSDLKINPPVPTNSASYK